MKQYIERIFPHHIINTHRVPPGLGLIKTVLARCVKAAGAVNKAKHPFYNHQEEQAYRIAHEVKKYQYMDLRPPL